jgi:hypothetical protein
MELDRGFVMRRNDPGKTGMIEQLLNLRCSAFMIGKGSCGSKINDTFHGILSP